MKGFPNLQILNGVQMDGMLADSLGDTGTSPYAYGHVVPAGPYRAESLAGLGIYNPGENAPYRFYSRGRGDNASTVPALSGFGAAPHAAPRAASHAAPFATLRTARKAGRISARARATLTGLSEEYATGIYSGSAKSYGVPSGRSNMPTLGALGDVSDIGKAAVLVGAGVLLAPWIKKLVKKVL